MHGELEPDEPRHEASCARVHRCPGPRGLAGRWIAGWGIGGLRGGARIDGAASMLPTGRRTLKVEPRPSSLSTWIDP